MHSAEVAQPFCSMNVGTDNHAIISDRCKYLWRPDGKMELVRNRTVGVIGEVLGAIIATIHEISFHDISTVTYFLDFNA
jgi:hypothetical protein